MIYYRCGAVGCPTIYTAFTMLHTCKRSERLRDRCAQLLYISCEHVRVVTRTFGCFGANFARRQPRDPFEAVCSECETSCNGCSFDVPTLVPTCEEAMEHSNSSGGTGTMEMLVIESGYWRATPSSPDVLECYHAAACLGGVTGTAGYCLGGYEGPCECFAEARGR